MTLHLDVLRYQIEHAERSLIRACVDHPDQRHGFAIWIPDLTMDEVVLARRVILMDRDDFRARIEVTDSLRGSALYDVRVYFTAQLNRITTPRLLQQWARECARAFGRQIDREIMDSRRESDAMMEQVRRASEILAGRWEAKKQPPTTACDWCPKVFPAADAYRSTKTNGIICPSCFEKARKGGRAHLVEASPGEEQTYGNILKKHGG